MICECDVFCDRKKDGRESDLGDRMMNLYG